MDIFINMRESINISDYLKIETEVDTIIYRQEFERHRSEYLKTKTKPELIFTFILLQIYIECFLHQNMRRIVGFEFKPPRDGIYTAWLEDEEKYIPAKIDNFATLFFSSAPNHIQQLIDTIKDRFGKISHIRNQFVHGHKVAAWSDSEGNAGSTLAKSLLSDVQLTQSITEVNELGLAWNDLLDAVLPQCRALKRIDDYKFSNIQSNSG